MKTMQFPESKKSNEFENGSHISRKQKAVALQFKKKNFKDIVSLINDEDDEISERYARYVK